MYENRQEKGRRRNLWRGLAAGEAGDTWEGGQDGVDAVSLWPGRNFRKFTDKGLYFLPEIVHSMRARGGWGQEERDEWERELTKVGLGSRSESLLERETVHLQWNL